MSTLRIETVRMAASALGPENPLPDLPGPKPPRGQARIDPSLPPEEQEFRRAAEVRGCLPYRVQDGYDRSETARPFQAAVLENEFLRAVFLLERGGRLWSLVHKPTGRELLYQPRILHYANVALRSAWFAGGVEWNIAVRGHAAHTCDPLFAARVRADDGSPVLRLYEWDRFRDLLFQIDFLLPDGAAALYVRPRTLNTRPAATPMYWWSNIAVTEAEGHRVLVPATSAYHYGYQAKMELIPIPVRDGVDMSYPAGIPSAHDYFYSIPEGNRPWIAGLDRQGAGLIQTSTSRLKGRKLFVWGMGPGGRRWQEHLGGRGTAYVEIQAGLGRTQQEYLPMPARAEWAWLEAYTLVEADGRIVHGSDWTAAYRHVEGRLDAMLPRARLEKMLAETAALADRPPEEILRRGSGWGALEERRRRADGESCAAPPSMAFDAASLGEDQAPWLALLEEGALPHREPGEAPGAWMTAEPWRRRLAAAVDAGRGDHWLAWLHLGVMAFHADDAAAAADAWRKSLARQASAWAYRNLAVLAKHEGRPAEAADLYRQASALRPDLVELQAECGRAMAEAGRFADLDGWLAGLPGAVRRAGRIRFLAARAAMERNDLAAAERMLEAIELADVREGEIALTDLWFAIQEKRVAAAEGVPIDDALKARVRQTLKPPQRLDYRMSQA